MPESPPVQQVRVAYHFAFAILWTVIGVSAAEEWITWVAFAMTTIHVLALIRDMRRARTA